MNKSSHGMTSHDGLRTAPPSVVIPWVFADVADSLSETDALRRRLTWEQHAARLRVCWQQYGAEFPREFAGALTRFSETGERRNQVVIFLLDIFAGDAKEETKRMHVTRNSQELWPLIVKELGQNLVLKRGADWTSAPAAETRGKVRHLLGDLQSVGHGKQLWGYYGEKGFANKNAKKLVWAFQGLSSDIGLVERKANDVIVEAKKAAIEATLKPAPWEVQ